MSKRSATDTIKQHNSDNKSGAIKQALDLIKNLENSKAGQINPEAMSALGQSQVAGMLKGLLGGGGGGGGGNQQENEEQKRKEEEEREALLQRIAELEQELAEQQEENN